MRKVLIIAIVILSLLLAALVGLIWYRGSHIFVEDAVYAKNAETLDLRGEAVSEAHYLTVQGALPDCEVLWNVPFQGGQCSSDVQQLAITTLAKEDIRILKSYFPKLTRIDASACKEYPLLAELAGNMPQCQVDYQVDLGVASADPGTENLVLEPGSYEFETLLTNLDHLPQLKTVFFPTAELSLQQQDLLRQAYPDVTVTSTVEILGKEYDGDTTVLDLSDMKSIDVEEVAPKLALLPNLSEVQLMGTSGSYLLLEDVRKLKDAAPEILFHYSFDFYGVTVTTDDREVTLKNLNVKSIPETGMADEIRAILDILNDCDRLVLDGRGQYDKLWTKISDEEMARIREEYRDKTSVVWRVYFGANGSSLTDAEVLRAVYGLTDDNSADMKYLEKVRYMDIGHNEFLDYCDFVSGMVSLEAVIISGAPIKSLEPFAACRNLKFLEMAECRYITDLSPLKECTQLEMLNISQSEITDISPLMDMNLTHLNTVANDVPEEDVEAFIAKHPDCWTVTEGNHYGEGWRYAKDGTLLPWYAKLDAEYHYISQRNIPNNIGWYLPEEA